MLEKIIYNFADKNNIIIGIGNAFDFENVRDSLKNTIPFVNKNIDERIKPSITMKNVKSIIAIGMGYNKKLKIKTDDKLRGKISIAAVGTDYHIIIKNKLEKLKNELLNYTNFESMIFCDTGPLVDKEVAKRCGLGWQGKNSLIISKKFGSMFFIGYMLTNLELAPSKSYDLCYNECGSCNTCIKNCPGNALSENGYNWRKCISYLTQVKNLDSDKYDSIGMQIYGCDVCQQSCKFNKNTDFEYITDIETVMPDIEKLLSISNKEYNNKYKNTAAGWRGKKILQRNAIIALGNIKDKKAICLLEKMKKDNREEISKAAKWSLQKIMEE